jgi:hypothetical protein
MARITSRYLEMHGMAADYPVSGIGELEQDLVRTRRESDDNDSLAAGVDKMPGGIVDGDVDVADTGRHPQRALAEHGNDPQILGAVLNKHLAV